MIIVKFMIDRPALLEQIREALQIHAVTALLGPRQCGKTTVARAFTEGKASSYFDLENPVDLTRLQNPLRTLEDLEGLVTIDEFQRKPELFELLRVLVDRPANPAQFLVLGSASLQLVKGASESLAGRIGFVDMGGFDLLEVGFEHLQRLWLRGGFPRSFLSQDNGACFRWLQDFVRTFLERDIPQLGITIPAERLRRFWTMIAHYHAQTWNAAEFGRSLGTTENTARKYLDILSGAYMVRVVPPWFENIKKRQVKAPKIYIRDSGILHSLLQIHSKQDLESHPKLGGSWEGFALEQVLSLVRTRDVYFWATHAGAELDLLIMTKGKRYGFEFKYGDAPGSSRSMHTALSDLDLQHMWVVYPGSERYRVADRITVLPLQQITSVTGTL